MPTPSTRTESPLPLNVRLPGVSFALEPSDGARWSVEGETVSLAAPALSDLFVDPSGGEAGVATAHSAAHLTGVTSDDCFSFVARAAVAFTSLFDAGAIVVFSDEDHWAKLCFERGPRSEHMVVSVVTQGVSDDANAHIVHDPSTWLRVSRQKRMLAFHSSADGVQWRLVRLFSLAVMQATLRVGLLAQSPTGEGCVVAFDKISYSTDPIGDPRAGR